MANSWQGNNWQDPSWQGQGQGWQGQGYPQAAPGYGTPLPVAHASLTRRFLAYLLDIVFIFGFTCLLWLAIAFLGVITFGLGWTLFAILPASGILYSAMTLGGAGQSTYGMRMLGLRGVQAETGAPVDWITAGVHALLFYVAVSTFLLWLCDVGIGLLRADRRTGHDLVVGLAIVRVA
ncbi:RDD domain containing protein [Methylobacterium sp. 4-46]|uniref:RDD family protein n=1 Tax=unclassified Methylobacterium TaxID=2615210 RepID=UPI000152D39F|nr:MULTISPECIES: RDD family protein [Methylobacterium]ACA21082.1 RDD domain containing protein [Methylobacterium sp. 4-46]WFT80231.1 RDD family protein [Methylobacterium nodulans]